MPLLGKLLSFWRHPTNPMFNVSNDKPLHSSLIASSYRTTQAPLSNLRITCDAWATVQAGKDVCALLAGSLKRSHMAQHAKIHGVSCSKHTINP